VALTVIHWGFVDNRYLRGHPAATPDRMHNSVMAAGFVLVSLELAGAKHLPYAAGGKPQNTGGLIDAVEVLLHMGILLD
jgi:hypothetical protein